MLYRVSYDSFSAGGPHEAEVHLLAVVGVEAESEEEAQRKAREIVMSKVRELLAWGGLVTQSRGTLESWIKVRR